MPPLPPAMRFVTIVTHHGTQLALDAASGEMVHGAPGTPGTVPLALVQFNGRPDVGLVLPLAAEPRSFRINGELTSRGGLAVFLTMMADGFGLHRAPTSRFLCAVPQGPDHSASVGFFRDDVSLWETFTRVEISTDTLPEALIKHLVPLAQLVAHGLTGPTLAGLLQTQGSGVDAWLEIAGRLLPLDQAHWFGANLLASAQLCVKTQLALAGDPWMAGGLPDLLSWLANRDAPTSRVRRVSRDLDAIDDWLHDDARGSFGVTAMLGARRAVQPRRSVCILATARNEGVYLLDWIAYHRAIGVEGFFLYSNGNDDGSDELLRRLAEAGEIIWFNNEVGPGTAPQFKAYGHALSMVPEILDYRWTLCIDLDEFVGFDARRVATLPDYLQRIDQQPTDAIGLCWLMFGSDGELTWRDEPLWERFHHHEPGVNFHVKTAFRSNRFSSSGCHAPRSRFAEPFIFRNAEGGMHHRAGDTLDSSFSAEPRADLAWIAHYYYKSASEFAWKKSRNTGDHPTDGDMQRTLIDVPNAVWFVNQHNNPAMEHDDRLMACARGAAAQKARLLALPGIAECEADLKLIYAERVRTIVERLRSEALPDAEREAFAALFK